MKVGRDFPTVDNRVATLWFSDFDGEGREAHLSSETSTLSFDRETGIRFALEILRYLDR